MSNVWVIQHVQCETLGTIAKALKAKDITVRSIRVFKGQPIPKKMNQASGLVIMGGPMGIYEQDQYPFLRQEIRLIQHALEADKPVLGICLGSQLLAAALGAEVTKGKQKEIGWFPVTLTEAAMSDHLWAGVEPSFTAYHWHGDIFELPAGAVSLASSELTECQAFRYGPYAYGLLFHMEVTQRIIQDMVAAFGDELLETGINSSVIVGNASKHLPRLQKVGGVVFQRWADLVGERSKEPDD
jgi:GMP synthase (glutamine-hydrolysing)